MKIYTSYFAKTYQFPDDKYTCIAISVGVPKAINIKSYKKLAPLWDIAQEYKNNGGDIERYKSRYYNEVLNQLDADDVVKELASISQDKDVVLICYEGIKNNDFCHRHLVSQWLRENGYDAPGELILNYYKNNKKILNPVKEITRIEF
jgi:uncharacterized protein YeaO (DUF488 family)